LADVKISALPSSSTPLAGTEILPIVQSSTTRQVSVANLTAGRAVSALSITASSLTSGRVTYAGTAGLLQDSANLTFNGTTLTANTIGAYTLSGTIAGGGNQINNVIIGTSTPLAGSFTTINASTSITNAGLTSGRVTYAGASGLLSDSSGLTYNGTNLSVNGATLTGGGAQVAGGAWSVIPYVFNSLTIDNASGAARFFATGANASTYGSYIWYGGLTTGATSEYMTLTTGGNLIIGNSTDALGSNRLYVQSASTAANNRTFSIYNTAATSTAVFANRLMQISSNGSGADVNIHFSDQTAFNAYIGMNSGALYFGTNGTNERMRIDSSGNLLLGTTSSISAGKLDVSSANRVAGFLTNSSSGTQDAINIGNQANAAYTPIRFWVNNIDTGSVVGSISCTTSLTSYNVTSDYRLKENVVPMTGALAKVAQLKPVTYKWKSNGSDGQGFIAHELQSVVPDCVTGEKDAVDADGKPIYQGMDTSHLVATLVSAIQELKAEFDAYKATHP
jgi:hypothetical protein